ncbi:MAG: hypothetical protein IJH18_01200 [Bacilli bacterium]|nr:hypothetical protein [Bacilli bacterium]
METISLKTRDIKNLDIYNPGNEVFNTESKLFVLEPKTWSKEGTLFKYLFIRRQSSLANKLFTVTMLNDNKKHFDDKTFIIPNKLVSVDNEISGFTIPFLSNNTNLGVLLNDLAVDDKTKIKYLKELGSILKRTEELNKEGFDFAFNDLHENNFIINHDDNDRLCAVDLDSSYMKTNYPQASHYLFNNMYINKISEKYPVNKFGINIPDLNSDLFCYNMIILNTIAHGKVSKLNINDYYMYINYLSDLGFGDNLLASFRAVYSSGNNINPVNYLDEINREKLGAANLNVFRYKVKTKQLF